MRVRYDCFLNEPDYHNVFHILNAKSHRREFEDMELHFIELEKFDKDFGELKTRLDHWTSFLTTVDQYDHDTMPLVLKNDPDVGPAIEALEHLSLTSDEREVYEARLKWLRDERSAIKKARAEGLAEGLTEGMEKGRTSEKRMIVRNAVQAGLETSVIAQLTGLTIEEIKQLQD